MNKKLLAVAVAGALGAPALAFAQAANVSIYGHFDGNLRISKYTSSSVAAAGVATTSAQTKQHMHFNAPRWGLRGSEDLGGGLTAFFQLESGMNPDGRPITTDGNIGVLGGRDSFLGLRGSWGDVRAGGFTAAYAGVSQIWNAVPSMGHGGIIMGNADSTGTAPNPNCNAAVAGATGLANAANTIGLGSFCASQVEGNATSFSRRVSNYLEYTSPVISGFQGRIGTALSENAEPSSQTTAVQAVNPTASGQYKPKFWSGMVSWSGGPFQVGFGYESHTGFRAANTAGSNRASKDKGMQAGVKWNFGAGELGFGWEKLKYSTAVSTAGAENGFQLTNWILNGNYKLSANGTISAGYSKTPGRKGCGAALTDALGTCGNSTGARNISLAYDHALSKRSGVYMAYGKISNNGNATAGATYNYIAAPLSNGGGGSVGGVVGGTDITTYAIGMKHSF